MSLHVVWRRVKFYWKKRLVRGAVALLVLSGALLLQYRFAKIPLPVDVEVYNNKFTIPPVMLEQEELVIESPVANPVSHQLLYHDGKPTESVNVTFDKARLSEGTIQTHGIKHITPLIPARIYVTEGARPKPKPNERLKPASSSQADEACRTNIRIELSDKEKPPTEIHFFQRDRGREFFRHLEMKASGAELIVQVDTIEPEKESADEDEAQEGEAEEEDEAAPPGCLKSLTVDGNPSQLTPFVQIVATPTADSTFKFHFVPLPGNPSSWGGKDNFYEPFVLGAPVGAPVIRAQGVSIKAFEGSVIFNVRAADAKSPLQINKLEVGEDKLKVGISGKGFVTIKGEEITVDLLDRIKKYPLIAGLFAVANAGLIAWLVRLIRGLFPSQR